MIIEVGIFWLSIEDNDIVPKFIVLYKHILDFQENV